MAFWDEDEKGTPKELVGMEWALRFQLVGVAGLREVEKFECEEAKKSCEDNIVELQ